MRPVVFIHTNARQILGALVSAHSLRRNSAQPDAFEVRILDHRDHAFFLAHEGDAYRRSGRPARWRNDDLQSFTPLRFMPPEQMGYQGRALVIDPDVFAVGDVFDLLSRDMNGKAVVCRPAESPNLPPGSFATSVMLLDCAKLGHWRCEEQFHELFRGDLDYTDWMSLRLEPRDGIGELEPCWNDFDRLTAETKLLHNTRRKTQPWKTGLPLDFAPKVKQKKRSPLRRATQALRRVFGDTGSGRYRTHPDPAQERLFFGLLRECLEQGSVSEPFLREEMALDHLRHDAFEVLERTPKLAP